jgi:transposase, IS5 family
VEIKSPKIEPKRAILRQQIVPQIYQDLLFELNPTLVHQRFLSTDVGQFYQSIPWETLANLVPTTAHAQSGLGCKPWFDVQGGIGLVFLKHFLQLGDAKLMERINTDWCLQYSCGIQLKASEQIKDKDLPSVWRCYLGKYLDIQTWQKALSVRWKKYMTQTQSSMQDATCYGSRIAHPTDVKLLWQSCGIVYDLNQAILEKQHQRKSRANHSLRKSEFLSYQKSKRKTRKQEKKLRKKVAEISGPPY